LDFFDEAGLSADVSDLWRGGLRVTRLHVRSYGRQRMSRIRF
jgi:hypothetical protein